MWKVMMIWQYVLISENWSELGHEEQVGEESGDEEYVVHRIRNP